VEKSLSKVEWLEEDSLHTDYLPAVALLHTAEAQDSCLVGSQHMIVARDSLPVESFRKAAAADWRLLQLLGMA
jgi:hypothetical protein